MIEKEGYREEGFRKKRELEGGTRKKRQLDARSEQAKADTFRNEDFEALREKKDLVEMVLNAVVLHEVKATGSVVGLVELNKAFKEQFDPLLEGGIDGLLANMVRAGINSTERKGSALGLEKKKMKYRVFDPVELLELADAFGIEIKEEGLAGKTVGDFKKPGKGRQ